MRSSVSAIPASTQPQLFPSTTSSLTRTPLLHTATRSTSSSLRSTPPRYPALPSRLPDIPSSSPQAEYPAPPGHLSLYDPARHFPRYSVRFGPRPHHRYHHHRPPDPSAPPLGNCLPQHRRIH